MNRLKQTAKHIKDVVKRLQDAGFETYIVGGAVRDLLLGRVPKDYDISTAATPGEVRQVFGRRLARIIGKRFRLVHLHVNNEIIEISTFRRRPQTPGTVPGKLVERNIELPDNLLFEDNDFGTAEEDAFRRDFTVNALFYDPITETLRDFTGLGMSDIENQTVRIIGNGKERFEEDPVRLLRALKLIGQYGFTFEEETEKSLRESIDLIKLAANSRLTLELEKILVSSYSDKIFEAFYQYGLLANFLPYLHRRWKSEPCQSSMELLSCRNSRVRAERYRNSASVAVATIALPFVAEKHGITEVGKLWKTTEDSQNIIAKTVQEIFAPHFIIKRITASSYRMLQMQPLMYDCKRVERMASAKNIGHARELLYIQNEVWWHRADLIKVWEHPNKVEKIESGEFTAGDEPFKKRRRRRRVRSKKSNKKVESEVKEQNVELPK